MGAVFGLFSGFYFWIGKITGYQYNIFLSQIQFWTLFIGVNLTFFPMHFLGLAGLPRRIPDFPDAYAGWNLICSYGSLLSVFSAIIFLIITIELFVAKRPYLATDTIGSFFGHNDSSHTLEFILSNPPAFHSFNQLPY